MLSQRAGGLICFLWQVAPLPGAPPLYPATDGLTPRVAREITEGTTSPPYLPRPSGAANNFDQGIVRIVRALVPSRSNELGLTFACSLVKTVEWQRVK